MDGSECLIRDNTPYQYGFYDGKNAGLIAFYQIDNSTILFTYVVSKDRDFGSVYFMMPNGNIYIGEPFSNQKQSVIVASLSGTPPELNASDGPDQR